MELVEKTPEKIKFIAKINISLANAIRRSVYEIPILAIDECDIYKNDSVLFDEIIAHRLGLIPLKNQNLKEGSFIEIKFKGKGKEGGDYILSKELGDLSVYPEIPIVYLEKDQEVEIVARARLGKGLEHSKFLPGFIYYRHYPHIKITKEGESNKELAEILPKVFSFKNKLTVKDPTNFEWDEEDLKDYPGIELKFDDTLVFIVESFGQISPKEIVISACESLKSNLEELKKSLK